MTSDLDPFLFHIEVIDGENYIKVKELTCYLYMNSATVKCGRMYRGIVREVLSALATKLKKLE